MPQMTAPREVVDAIEIIRQGGRCNMLDRNCVQVEADRMGEYATVVWLEDHRRDYAQAFFHGLTAEDE